MIYDCSQMQGVEMAFLKLLCYAVNFLYALPVLIALILVGWVLYKWFWKK
jgi:hypothetical protein